MPGLGTRSGFVYVYDWRRVVGAESAAVDRGEAPRLVEVARGDLRQLGNPAADVGTVGVEALGLTDRGEDPPVRSSAASCYTADRGAAAR